MIKMTLWAQTHLCTHPDSLYNVAKALRDATSYTEDLGGAASLRPQDAGDFEVEVQAPPEKVYEVYGAFSANGFEPTLIASDEADLDYLRRHIDLPVEPGEGGE